MIESGKNTRYNNNRAPNKYKFSRRLIKVRRKILKRKHKTNKRLEL